MPASPEQIEQAQLTRAALVSTARELFATKGYFETGTEEIVARANVTRGALYHHFSDKTDLFRAVVEAIFNDMREQEDARAPSDEQDAWASLRATFESYITRITRDLELRRIAVIDGPAVLGWSGWRELERRYGLGVIEIAAKRAMREGAIRPAPIEPLSQMLLAAINEGSLLIAESEDPDSARAEVTTALTQILDGLRAPPAQPADGGGRRR